MATRLLAWSTRRVDLRLAAVVAIAFVGGCGGGPEGAHVARPTTDDDRARDAAIDSRCARESYAQPPQAGLPVLSVVLTSRVSRVFTAPTRVCALLDGVRLLSPSNAADAGRHFLAGESLTVAAGVTPSTWHSVLIVVDLKGTGPLEGYAFRVRSEHRFALVDTAPGSLEAVLEQKPDVPPERALTFEWKERGAFDPNKPPPWR